MHNDKASSWSFILGLGTMDEEDFVVDNGLLFGAYESGPWVGYVVPGGKELEGWVAAGEEHYEFMVRKLIFLGDRSDIYIIMTSKGLETYMSIN